MKSIYLILFSFFLPIVTSICQSNDVFDDFEGNGTIESWAGGDCGINTALPNPYSQGVNSSSTVLEYHDTGGQYAHIMFNVQGNFEMEDNSTFSLKIYIPTDGLTGNEPNQVSLKLQNGFLSQPWSTQSEIIKSVTPDEWQTISFDFETDNYINFNVNDGPPIERKDFNRVVIQVNGENNNSHVLAYIDDFYYNGVIETEPDFNDLVWSDEFNADGALNNDKWHHQTLIPQGSSWFNGEIQHYTDRIDNTIIENGILKIIAKKETYTDQGYTKDFTSARINTKFAFTYGKVEIRAKLPSGIGTWPALWTLGKNISERGAYWQTQGFGDTPWPKCGEIDIMEHWGNNQNFVQSAIHTPSSHGNTQNKGGQTIPTASEEFHTYTMIWTEDKLVFKVDDETHYMYHPTEKNADTWPFDLDQYLILNFAILPSIDTNFSQASMDIDYVRIYQDNTSSVKYLTSDESLAGYPNPVKNEFTISLEGFIDQSVNVKIYNVDGTLVRDSTAQINDSRLYINQLQNLPKGTYLLNFRMQEQSYSVKFIKG